jgi:divalent metal cation (Fe/Co/Zn/Cd) transporter
MDGSLTLNEAHERASKIERQIKDRFGKDTHVTIHMEPVKER